MLRKDCLSGSINKNELMKIKCAQLLLLLFLLASCEWIEQRSSTNTDETAVDTLAIEQAEEPTLVEEKMPEVTPLEQLADTSFVRLADYSDQFAFDMRYATDNNFLKEQVYDCPECYTRTKTAKALIAQAKAAAPPADSETTESVADATVADSFVFDTPPIPQLPKIMPEALRPIDKALFQQILAETRRQHNTALPQQRKAAG